DEVKFGRLLNRKIVHLRSLEYPPTINASFVIRPSYARTIADQTTRYDELSRKMNDRYRVLGGQFRHCHPLAQQDRIARNESRSDMLISHRCECSVEVTSSSHIHDDGLLAKILRRFFCVFPIGLGVDVIWIHQKRDWARVGNQSG